MTHTLVHRPTLHGIEPRPVEWVHQYGRRDGEDVAQVTLRPEPLRTLTVWVLVADLWAVAS